MELGAIHENTTEDVILLQLAVAATEQPLAKKRGRMLEKKNANEAINPSQGGIPKHIPVTFEVEEFKEVQSVEDEIESLEGPESSETVCHVQITGAAVMVEG